MRRKIAVAATAILFSCWKCQITRHPCVGFFWTRQCTSESVVQSTGSLLDGMPVNFQFPLDASSLSETDFEVLDELGNVLLRIVRCWPRPMKTESRTVLLLGEFGTAVSNPPVEVRIVVNCSQRKLSPENLLVQRSST